MKVKGKERPLRRHKIPPPGNDPGARRNCLKPREAGASPFEESGRATLGARPFRRDVLLDPCDLGLELRRSRSASSASDPSVAEFLADLVGLLLFRLDFLVEQLASSSSRGGSQT